MTRRDVRYRGYPFRNGAYSTALEICTAAGCSSDDTTKQFFTSLLGNNNYVKMLADGHTKAIHEEYDINGRYRRAFMINPGYEWTPTQTGGTPIFSVSQKLFMFALITLDEGIATSTGCPAPASGYPAIRRRMLLASSVGDALKDGQSAFGGVSFQFQTSPAKLLAALEGVLASAYGVPNDKVATYSVKMQLTDQEGCMDNVTLAESVRENLADIVKNVATAHETVQILTMTRNFDRNDIQCRRSLHGLNVTVNVTMAVVFALGMDPGFNMDRFADSPSVVSIAQKSAQYIYAQYCGDNVINNAGSEECDDGNTDDFDGCWSTCVVEYCGDNVINNAGSEECDDGNTDDLDGCSATCLIENPPEDAPIVRMVVMLPYTVEGFFKEGSSSPRNKFKRGVAAAAKTVPDKVIINAVTAAAARRRMLLVGSVDVDFSVVMESTKAAEELVTSGQLTLESLNAELAKEGMETITAIKCALAPPHCAPGVAADTRRGG